MRIVFVTLAICFLSIFTTTTVVAQNGAPQIVSAIKKSYNGSDMSCTLANDAQITVTATGGTGKLQYSKDNGVTWQTSNVFSNLSEASYQMTVKDVKGLMPTVATLVIITHTFPLMFNQIQKADAKCSSSSDGWILSPAQFGTGTLQYSKDNGANYQTASTFNNLAAGSYQLMVKDANGCTVDSTVTIKATTNVGGSVTSQTNTTCGSGATGSVTVQGSGGTSYTYNIDGGNFSFANTFNNLTPGSHSVTVKEFWGCTTTVPVTITAIQAPAPTISYAGSPYCNLTSSALHVTITGASGGTFTVSPAGLSINSGTGDIIPSASIPGTYTVTYSIAATTGCASQKATTSVTITAAPSATISYTGSPFCNSLGGIQNVNRTGSTGGTYSSTAGLSINSSTGAITPSSSTPGTYTVTYTMGAANGCSAQTATTSVTITAAPSATISYTGSPFCNSLAAQNVNRTGSTGGTYSSTAGLSINASTGAITPSSSTPGTYTVTYTMTASGCSVQTATTSVTITAAPSATISYSGSPFCNSLAAQNVNRTGSTGGTYSSTAGLSINASTGAITPSSSTPGTYTVTYTMAATGGCSAQTATTSVTITAAPSATISYTGSPFCNSLAAQNVNRTGTLGGTYSSTAGLSINASTGSITPASSTPGTYTVTYTMTASGCSAQTATTSVTITAAPSATISYTGSPFCNSLAAQNVNRTGSTGGTYSSTAGLSINSSTGAIIPSSSTPGTYTVTYTMTASGCSAQTATTSVTITAAPSATISYTGSPFCNSLAGEQYVSRSGTTGGTYSAAAGLSINSATGTITPSTSTPGTYTITYTMTASGCSTQTATTSVTINAAPSATLSYTGSPYCSSLGGVQNVNRTGTTGGTYSASPAGLIINSSTGAITPSTSPSGTYTVTYTMTASGCSAQTATTSVTINAAPSATISYSGAPFCTSIATAQNVTRTGTTGGTYSASPAGLSINSSTGAITPSSSTPGTYTVTYTMTASGCSAQTATTSVTITAAPSATISYTGSPFCNSLAAQNVNRTGSTGGTYSSTAGLSINSSTGAITPSSSTPGTYTVTYTMAATGGCSAQTATTSVTITAAPSATISYTGSPFCNSLAAQNVNRTGTLGGTYSSTAGLSINASTGSITPSSSTPGTYTVTYTMTASGCSAQTATTTVTITVAPSATISYTGSPFCNSLVGAQNVNRTGTTGGTYSSTAGLSINSSTGAITPSSSTPGTYTVTYTMTASGCSAQTATTSVTITAAPSATISYTGSPFCNSLVGAQNVNTTGTTGGTYSTTAGLSINSSTGAITPSSSTPGTYTVTYTMAATGGCSAQATTTSVTITSLPSAKIAYPSSLYCTNANGNQSVQITGTTGGSFTVSPAGLNINAANGDITPTTSKAGSYTITYTMAAAGGCSSQTATTSVTIVGAPSANISYSGAPFCNSLNSAQNVTMSGTTGGTYTAPNGLNIDTNTGAITPLSSTPGNYTVTYTVSKMGLVTCPATTATAEVVITAVPSASISYATSPFCNTNQMAESVTLTGTSGGVFSASNLKINASTGGIIPGQNSIGNYTVNYSIPAAGGCASFATSTAVSIGAPGTWTGKVDNNWDNISNWICGKPGTTIDAYIPNTAPVFPIVSSNTAAAKNVTIDAGASLTDIGSLQIAGTISNKGTFDVTNGTLEFVYSAIPGAPLPPAQTISGSWFVDKTIKNLVVSNTKGLNLSSTANDTLNITGTLSFGVGNTTFATNNNLTLKSTANGSASVADITNNGAYKGNSITGNVTVERYINMGTQPGQHNKAWVMLSTPAQGESIYQTWMEGGNKTIKGYGTQITGNGTGFDSYSAGPALKYYNDANNTWTAVTNTSVPVYNPLGYILFVRGDRTTAYPNISNTTLRTTGTLLCGTSVPVAVKGGKFQSVGNPYASAVDIRKISTTNINPDIIVWDATLTTGNAYGVGAYQTLYKDGNNYRNLLTSDAYGNAGTINNNIESGVAFFVQSFNTDGQVYFTESAKATNGGSGIAMRAQGDSDNGISLKTTLYVMNPDSTSFVTDGTMEQFSTDYSNAIDGMDTKKLTNTSENLSIRDQGNYLVIDRRNYLTAADTIFYNLTGVTNRNYRLIFNGSNLSTMGVTGFIADTYTNTKTPLNADGDTQLDFTVSAAAGSKVANRFYIVFKTLITMPVTFTSIKASPANTTIAVDWSVENQKNLKEYDVERSADGNNFSQVGVVAAINASAATYNWVDQNPFSGNNYYRVKSVDLDGKVAYTSVVKAQIGGIATSMDVYPNPAVNANVNIRFNNEPAGVYYARLLNQLGQVIVSKKIVVNAGSSTENIEWNKNEAKGIYELQITMPDGGMKSVKIVY